HRIERDLADGGAGVNRAQPQRLVGDVVIVRGGQDLLLRLQGQAAVQEGEAGGRVAGQRDLVRLAARVVCGGCAHRLVLPAEVRLAVRDRILVEGPAVSLDRVADRARGRGE